MSVLGVGMLACVLLTLGGANGAPSGAPVRGRKSRWEGDRDTCPAPQRNTLTGEQGTSQETCAAAAAATAGAKTTNAEAATADASTGGLPTTLLPDGWVCRAGQAPSGQKYERYAGPNGERAQSLKQVMAAVAVVVAAKEDSWANVAAEKEVESAVVVAEEKEEEEMEEMEDTEEVEEIGEIEEIEEIEEMEEMDEMEDAEVEEGECPACQGKHKTHTCRRSRELVGALCNGAQAANRYTYQDYATSTFSCLGFDEGEEYAFFERRADGRRERVPVTEKTAANLAGYLSSYFGKLKKKPCRVPRLHRLPPCLQGSAEVAISTSISVASSAAEVEAVVTEATEAELVVTEVEDMAGAVDEAGAGDEGGEGDQGEIAEVVAEVVVTREGDGSEEPHIIAEHEGTISEGGCCIMFEYTYQEHAVSAFTFLGFDEGESYAFYERKADGRQES